MTRHTNKTVCAVLAIVLALILTGCDGFLTAEPEALSTVEEFYQNEEQVRIGLNGAYGNLQNLYSGGYRGGFWIMTEMRSDNTTFQYYEGDRYQEIAEHVDLFQITLPNDAIEGFWNGLYGGILQANAVVNSVEEVDFEDEEVGSRLAGQAKFLRALYYFHLVRLWGGVPVVTREVSTPDQAFSEKSTSQEVYEQIISDASDAAASLPVRYDGQQGRATEGASRTLLAEVHLTRGEFDAAIEQLQQVEAMPYELVPDYADVFDPSMENGPGSIFEVQYDTGIANGGEASSWIYSFVPLNSGDAIIPFPLDPNPAGFNIPTFDMVEAYEGEERREASVAFYEADENRAYDVALGDSIPYIKKYLHELPTAGQTSDNWPVYRYAHVLLMMAEALNETGQTAEAAAYLNRVRERAGLDPVSGLSQSAFREAVYHEMRLELAFESHRWYNLKRTDRAIEVMREHGAEMLQRTPRLTEAAYNIDEYKLLYPIPTREVRLNDIEQNPGW